jgi:hypothetical protein
MGDALGLVARLGLVLDGFEHLRVEHQLLDQLPPSRQLEGRDLQLEPLVELVDSAVHAPPQPPSHRRREKAVDEGNGGQQPRQDGEPERDCHRRCHVRRLPRDESASWQ